MYCKKCGKEYTSGENYCDNCGEKLDSSISNEETKSNTKKNKTNTKKKKFKTKWLILFIFLIFIFTFSTTFFITSVIKYTYKVANLENIKLDIDNVPTMFKENKNIKIDDIEVTSSNGEIKVEVTYETDLYKYDMINKYSDFLEKNGFTLVQDDYYDWFLIKKSNNKDKVIIVNIYKEDNDSFTVVYELKYGSITNYITPKENKRLGKEIYGYIDLDDSFIEEIDDGLLKYSNNNNLVILYYQNNLAISLEDYVNNLKNIIIDERETEVEIISATIDNNNGYQLSGYDKEDNIYFAIWCFVDKNNTLHYIEIDSTKENSEIFAKINSYRIEK